MEKHLQPLVHFLESNDWMEEESEFVLLQYDIVDGLEEHQIGPEAIQPILELMEQHPLVEFGTPGPLTHFMEKFYKENSPFYERLLLQSVTKQPTVHTVWLLNRVINTAESDKAKEYIQMLKTISENKALHQDIQAVSMNFLDYQNEN